MSSVIPSLHVHAHQDVYVLMYLNDARNTVTSTVDRRPAMESESRVTENVHPGLVDAWMSLADPGS